MLYYSDLLLSANSSKEAQLEALTCCNITTIWIQNYHIFSLVLASLKCKVARLKDSGLCLGGDLIGCALAHNVFRSLWMVSPPSCQPFGEERGAGPPPVIQITRSYCVNLAWKPWTSEQEDDCERRHLLPSHLFCSRIYSSPPIGSVPPHLLGRWKRQRRQFAARDDDNDRHAYGCGSHSRDDLHAGCRVGSYLCMKSPCGAVCSVCNVV